MEYTLRIIVPTKKEILYFVRDFLNIVDKKSYAIEASLYKRANKLMWRLLNRITKRCGSREYGHYPIFGNEKPWMWSTLRRLDKQYSTCTVCGYKAVTKIGFPLERLPVRNNREADIKELNRLYSRATNDTERIAIKKSLFKINNEDKHVRAMREKLVDVTRRGEQDEIKDIHDSVVGKENYNTDR